MHKSTTPYWWGDSVSYHGERWKVLGVKGDMRLIRLWGTGDTVRVSVATLNLNNS